MPAVYEVFGPLPKQENPFARRSPFWENGFSIASQYTRCRSAENPEIHCFELRQNELAVGFLGLSLSREGDATQLVAFASVEYIFVKPSLRGRGLGMTLLERALYVVSLWLLSCATKPLRWSSSRSPAFRRPTG